MAAPIQMEYIHTFGKCAKADFIDVIIDKLTDSGWEDISSNYETDGYVFMSPGRDGDKKLILNWRAHSGTPNSGFNNSSSNAISYRLQPSYIPGEPGEAGTFGRPSLAWKEYYILAVLINPSVELKYYMYVDKNHISFQVMIPQNYNSYDSFSYWGVTDTSNAPEGDSTSVIWSGTDGNGIFVTGNSLNMSPATAAVGLTASSLLHSFDPTGSELKIMSPIYLQGTGTGYRFKLDGMWVGMHEKSVTGDIFRVKDRTVQDLPDRLFHAVRTSTSPYTSSIILVEIEAS